MNLTLLVVLIVYFLIEIVLSGVLIYTDVRAQLKSKGSLGHDYRWDRALGVLFGVAQTGLSVAGVVLAVSALISRREECKWLDVGMVCNIQLLVGANLAHILQHLYRPNWAIRLVYATTLAIVLLMAGVLHYINEATPVFASSLLPCVFASVLSSVLPYRPLKDNKMAGTSERSGGYRQLLSTLIFTNAAAAFVQLCGAMILAGALLTGRSTSSDLRRGVVLTGLHFHTVAVLLCAVHGHFRVLAHTKNLPDERYRPGGW